MNKAMFNEFIKSVKQGGEILRGKRKPSREFHFEDPDVQKIRKKIGLSQTNFARLLGISVSTLRNWEQGRRKPHGPARVLLGVAAKYPEVLPTVVGW